MITWIYGLTVDGEHIRYVGKTECGIKTRFQAHQSARPKNPVSRWTYENRGNLRIVVLQALKLSGVAAGRGERFWVHKLWREGHDLLNVFLMPKAGELERLPHDPFILALWKKDARTPSGDNS